MSRSPGGEKARFGAERHVWAAQTWRSRASRLREAAGEVPRPLPAPLRVPESRSDESAGQGKHRRPNTRPGSPPGAPLHPLPPAAGACSGSSALAPPDSHPKCDGKFFVFFFFLVGGGEREGAPGCWGALKELGELGTGVETLVVPWSLVRRPDLELAITCLFCLGWHTCEVVWFYCARFILAFRHSLVFGSASSLHQ